MKLSYNLLKSWLKFNHTPEELASIIDLHITEVEAVTPVYKFPQIVVGKILEITPHPNADKVRLTRVDVGTEILKIVCGGKNIEVGQKVPVALPGCILPTGAKIEAAVIRGEESFGMICSAAELGLPSQVDGILVLPPSTEIGQSFDEARGASLDYSIEIKVLSNRPDYTSYLGVARELAAALKLNFKSPIALTFEEVKLKTRDYLKVEVGSTVGCSRYAAKVVRNVKVEPSPAWLQDILLASGMRPINNLVDAANLVMLETGHPVHIFDYNKLGVTQLFVRNAKAKEKFVGLDGELRKLDPDTLVISDDRAVLAVAGIFGSRDSGVSELTQDIVVEVAHFDPVSIRKSSRKLGLRSEASARFERGVNILDGEMVMARLMHVVQGLLPDATIFNGVIDIHGKLPDPSRTLTLSVKAMAKLLGITVPNKEIIRILTALDLPATVAGDVLTVTVPHHRQDIGGMVDIAEEIIRIYGTDQVPFVLPQTVAELKPLTKAWSQVSALKDLLSRMQLTEVRTHAFDRGSKLAIALENPLNENWTHMKTELLPGLHALDTGRAEFGIFEVAKVFQMPKKGQIEETLHLAVKIQGPDAYRKCRGIIDALNDRYKLNLKFQDNVEMMTLVHAKQVVGHLRPQGTAAAGFEIDLSACTDDMKLEPTYASPSKYPPTKMDMAFAISAESRIGALVDAMFEVDPRVVKVELFDVFELPNKLKSAAFHIELQSADQTLTKEVRETIHAQIVSVLEREFRAKLRD